MNKLIFVVITLVFGISGLKAVDPNKLFRIATFNIRIQTPADTAARAWENRKADVARIICDSNFDLLAVQEIGNEKQSKDLKKLIPDYTYIGYGRDNQQGTTGEQIGIFYKTKRYNIVESGFFFLSETPDVLSIGWDANYRRICVWAKVFDVINKKTFYVFCTHFDHIGVKARVESAKLIVSRINIIAGEFPVILLGDLNATTEETEMYQVLSSSLNDSFLKCGERESAISGTFNGFDISENAMTNFKRIDYIFTRKIKVKNYKVLTQKYSEGSYPSDHFPVMIEAKFR